MLEYLETRRHFSAAIDTNGVLVITGTAGADVITIEPVGNDVVVAWRVWLNGATQSFSEQFNSIRVEAGDGNDIVDLRAANAVSTLIEGAGKDRLISSASAMIEGGGGNDQLCAGSTLCTLLGGRGDDYMFVLLPGNQNNDSALFLPGGSLPDAPATMYGGQGNDTLYGSGGKDYLSGDEGNDTIDGLTNADRLVGGSGDDALSAYYGGPDTILGGAGDDVFTTTRPSNIFLGGPGRDEIRFVST